MGTGFQRFCYKFDFTYDPLIITELIPDFIKRLNNFVEEYDIKYISLQGADLSGAYLSGLKLPANLRGADLTKTDLRGAYLGDAKISQEQLNSAIVDETTELPQHLMHNNGCKNSSVAPLYLHP